MRRAITFGVFEVDLRAGQLRKSGRPLQLQEQPFRILEVLLERPGEVVTREEFRRRIWGDDVYVDFDRSLNTGVARLREALGDSPTRPIYIETVPRRGYRFIAPVGAPVQQPLADEQEDPAPSPARLGWRSGLLLAAALTAAALAGRYWGILGDSEAPARPPAAERLTAYMGAEDEPVFSPDGNQFAFTWNGEAQDNFDIYVRTVTAEKPLRLTDHPSRDSSPAWSPDGQWIAFERAIDEGRIAIYRISPLGGREEQLLELPGRRGYEGRRRLAWTPDSQHLVIETRREGDVMDWGLILFGIRTRSQRDSSIARCIPAFRPTAACSPSSDSPRAASC